MSVLGFQCVIAISRDELVEFLYDRQEDMSKWNPTVNDCRVSFFYVEQFLFIISFSRY